MSETPIPSTEAPWHAGLRSARANLVPGLCLQALALGLVGSYYFVPPVSELLGGLAAWRARTGLISSFISTALFGGALPLLYLRLLPATRHRFNRRQALALVIFWGAKGVEVDLFYRLLAATVGTGHDLGTITTKALIDQFVYCPLLAMPNTWIAYRWIEHHFRWDAVGPRVRAPGWFTRDLLPLMVANFGVWAPMVVIIYLLPTPLQLPLQNIVLCFFTLMVAHLAQAPAPSAPPPSRCAPPPGDEPAAARRRS